MFRRIRSTACAVSMAAVLAACANQSVPQSDDSLALPQRADGVENISISRDRLGGGLLRDRSRLQLTTKMSVSVNGQDVGTLRRGELIKFGLEAGRYDIGIGCSSPYSTHSGPHYREISVEVGEESVEINASRYVTCERQISSTQNWNRNSEQCFKDSRSYGMNN